MDFDRDKNMQGLKFIDIPCILSREEVTKP